MSNKKKLLILIGAFIAIVIVISLIYIAFNPPAKKSSSLDKSKENAYTDPGSGETIYNPPGQAPENGDSATMAFLGFSNLLNIGLSTEQVTNLESYFSYYSMLQKQPIKEVSITLTSVQQKIDQSSGQVTVTFVVTLDRKTKLNTLVTYTGISDVQLTLYNPSDNSEVFSSVQKGE